MMRWTKTVKRLKLVTFGCSNGRHRPSFSTVAAPHYVSSCLLNTFSVVLMPHPTCSGVGFWRTADFSIEPASKQSPSNQGNPRRQTFLLPPPSTHPSPNGITPFHHRERPCFTACLSLYLMYSIFESHCTELAHHFRLRKAAACNVKSRDENGDSNHSPSHHHTPSSPTVHHRHLHM